MTDAAVEFIDENKDGPFFIYLSYNAPHTPLRALEKFQDDVAHIETEPERVYAAMLLSIDEGVGRVMAKLREHGLEEDTLVAFVSDNGPTVGKRKYRGYRDHWPEVRLGSSGPLKGGKFQLDEGGIRMPYILHYPTGLPAGVVEDRMVSTLDLYPTFCALAGYTPPETTVLEGKDLMPYLTGEDDGPVHEQLFWSDGSNRSLAFGAVRQGAWKLHLRHRDTVVPLALYNLTEDIDESDNLAEQNPEKVAELKAQYVRWMEANAPHQGDTVDIDNSREEHVSTTGDWKTDDEAMWEQGENYLQDGNAGKGEKTVRFDLPVERSGYYEVQTVWPRRWPDGTVLSENTPVTVNHYGGSTTVTIDQSVEYTPLTNDAWVSLGNYYFEEGRGSVIFSNEGTRGTVVVDSVRMRDWTIHGTASPRRWRRTQWGMPVPDPEIMARDSDEDGLINMEEFALGLDPLSPDAEKAEGRRIMLDVIEATPDEISFMVGAPAKLDACAPLASWIAQENSSESPREVIFPDSQADPDKVHFRLKLQDEE
jgi:hypothetical protein